MSRCWAARFGGGGTQHKGLAREGRVAHVGWLCPRWTLTTRAGFLPCGAGFGVLRVPTLGPQCRAKHPAGPPSFRGQTRAHAAGASGRPGLSLAPKSERESH